MPTLLHILTKPEDKLAAEIIAVQTATPANRVEIVDLTSSNPDYKALVEKIFSAENIQVW